MICRGHPIYVHHMSGASMDVKRNYVMIYFVGNTVKFIKYDQMFVQNENHMDGSQHMAKVFPKISEGHILWISIRYSVTQSSYLIRHLGCPAKAIQLTKLCY